jgi:anti-sigma factor ChrR (cupin superfamily)
MNETFQTGLHPDADQLAAFAEQALPLHEREQTLAHLAVCNDCRQIVFLAQAAAPQELPQVAAVPARRPWFSGWNLLWPAVAALAGIVGFSVYLGRVGSQDRAAQITTAAVSSPQPPPAAQAPEPVAKPAILPEAKVQMRGGVETNSAPTPPKSAMAQAKQPAVASPGPLHNSLGTTSDSAAPMLNGTADLPIEGRNTNSLVGAVALGSPAGMGRATGAAALHGAAQPPSPQRLQSLAEAPRPATASPQAAPAPPPPAPALVPQLAPNQAPTQGYQQNQAGQNNQLRQTGQASQTVNVEANAAAIQLDSTTLATLSSLVPVLPSHLETISSTSNGSERVAVDSGGSVFLSRDDGKHWKSVSEAWAGRPVKVELADPATPDLAKRAKTTSPTSQDATGAAAGSSDALASDDAGAQLHGVVTDATGASIPGAQVRVQAAGGTTATTVRTDAAGRFQAAGIPPGRYQITIAAQGFSTLVRTVDLDAHTPMGFTAVLPVGAASETVMVSGALSAPRAKKIKSPGFQLTTDTGAVWVSSDGRNWKRR